MKFPSFLSIFASKEREVINLLIEHLTDIREVIRALHNALANMCEKSDETLLAVENVFKFEDEADEVKRKISARLAIGAFLPATREDLFKFVSHVDEIATGAEELAVLIKIQKGRIVGNPIKGQILFSSDLALATVSKLREATIVLLEAPGKEDAAGILKELHEYEHQVDIIKNEAYSILMEQSGQLGYMHFWLLKEVIDKIEGISNATESAAETLVAMTMARRL
ncbi:MAG: DUF47 family protein [Euryarchaeota archaeon]|nr:DUF47 family protein [Euryarchaeota archaeon]